MDDDDMENRFHPLGMEQRNWREDDDTKERFSILGAKIWGRRKDTYNEDDNTEHTGRPGYAQPHQRVETKNFDNYTVKRESNYEGDDPFNIKERSTPLHQKWSNNDEDDNDHLDDPFFCGNTGDTQTWQHNQGIPAREFTSTPTDGNTNKVKTAGFWWN